MTDEEILEASKNVESVGRVCANMVYDDCEGGRTFSTPSASHQQVFTGLGFTCDSEMLPFILSVNDRTNIQSGGCCQATKEWAVSRRWLCVVEKNQDPHRLLEFLISIDRFMGGKSGYKGSMLISTHAPHNPKNDAAYGYMEWTPNLDTDVLCAMDDWRKTQN